MGLNSVTPKYSAIGGGSSILFAGNGFVSSAITGANIDGVACTGFVRLDDFQITANSPAHAFTDTSLNSQLTGGATFNLPASFYYIKAPLALAQVDAGTDIFGLTGTLSVVILTVNGEAFLTFLSAGGVITWSKLSGPGTLTFTGQGTKNAGFTASVKGTYTIRCSVVNSLGSVTSDNTVTMHGLPVVDAGADGNGSVGSGYNLVGSATE